MDTVDSGNVILSVSESLRYLIKNNISELSSETAISFQSPAEIENVNETKLLVYLYQINSNPYLRNTSAGINFHSASAKHLASIETVIPPLAVDLLYLFVPYAKRIETELIVANKLKQLFYKVAVLKADNLQGVLKQTGNANINIAPSELSIDAMRNIWMGFQNKSHKLSLTYLLSPIKIPSNMVEQEDMVMEVKLGNPV